MSGAKPPLEPRGPTLSAKGAEDKAARQARQAAALRANLPKRKAQVRARRDAPETSAKEAGDGRTPPGGGSDRSGR